MTKLGKQGAGPPTHSCARCRRALWDRWWPYALCKACAKLPCRHGNKVGECNECLVEEDRAYDASRGA